MHCQYARCHQPDANFAVRVEHYRHVIMPGTIAALGDGSEDPLAAAPVVAPVSAEHAVERDAVAEVIPFGRALPRVPMARAA